MKILWAAECPLTKLKAIDDVQPMSLLSIKSLTQYDVE